jgi:hypothetical protein
MARAYSIGRFVRSSLIEFRAMVVLHATTAILVAGVVLILADGLQGRAVLVDYALAYAALGLALLLTSTLLSLGHVTLAAGLVCAAAGTQLIVVLLTGLGEVALAQVQLALMVGLLLVAYRLTSSRFATASAHR